jgi:exodeoxyribonuclease III
MRIATWNVNGVRARTGFILDWLKERQPDVVGLQELKATEENFPFKEFADAGYSAVIHGQKAWNGVAILSKSPAEVIQVGLPGQETAGSRMIAARIEEVNFISVYCPNGKSVDHPDFSMKLNWFQTLADYLEKNFAPIGQGNLVLVGDLNICPSALDTWDEESHQGCIFHTDLERDKIILLKSLGLTDLFRFKYPEEKLFSWWDYRGGSFYKNQGLRIDLLLGSPALRERVTHVYTDRDFRKKRADLTPSDHAPVIAELD